MLKALTRIAQPAAVCLAVAALVQLPGAAPQFPDGPGGPPPFGQGGGRMGGAQQEVKLVAQFDKDGDKRLNATERKAALEYLTTQGAAMGGRGRMGGGFGRGGGMVKGEPGPRLTPADVRSAGNAPLYDMATLRTLFLEFEDANWEDELMAFKNTDVEVLATLVVDAKRYPDVGVRFRGMSSFMMVPEGLKHSINVSMNFVHRQQTLGGYRTLNLLNSHEDPTYLRSVLFYQAARDFLPAPKANFVRVAINGESWGAYVNAEQFNQDFVNEWFNTTGGARWKVPGSPGARGGLEYLGDDPAPYKRIYEIKSKDDAKSWADFARLCKVLNQTPASELEAALKPILDVDQVLKFLALDAALVNNDGYWVRSSDYSIYEDVTGRFHILPQDANETFSAGGGPGGPGGPRGLGGPGGPGRPGGPDGRVGPGGPDGPGGPANGRRGFPGMGPGRGPGGGGVDLDPLVGLNDATKPLRSKLLAVPALRARYMSDVREISVKWLDWNRLGPLVETYQALIADTVKADTRKLDSFDAFRSSVAALKTFVEQRRKFLLEYKPATEAGEARPAAPRGLRPATRPRPANA